MEEILKYSLKEKLNNITKSEHISKTNQIDKSKAKELFNKFKENIVSKLEEQAQKNIKSYQVPVDNWEISANIEKWCKKNKLKYFSNARKVDQIPPFKEKNLKVDEVRLMMISWD